MHKHNQDHKILILDFGSQYTQLIARRIRECGVYCEISTPALTESQILAFNPSGIILSGGPNSTVDCDSPQAPSVIFNIRIPILGICYGMQLMALQLGGAVAATSTREFGHAQVEVQLSSPLLDAINDSRTVNGQPLLNVWMSHGDQVTQLPEGFVVLASTASCQFAAMADEKRRFYGLQFHPEVTHTCQGKLILDHFVKEICGCPRTWTTNVILDEAVASIQRQVGRDDRVILGLSGGVDSSVTALLLQRAIGQRLICVFVDNGLLRQNESAQVKGMFDNHLGANLITIDAEQRFLKALQGVTDPEAKRKIIGRLFIEIFDEQAAMHYGVKWLAQGTIYSDVIESAAATAGYAQVIKSHHNVGGLPETMTLNLLEPLRLLFKDEVRSIGLQLGMPYEMLYRHPFPGPGLGVRILGEIRKPYCDLLRRADMIFIEALHQADLYYKVSQAFAVFLAVRSVGVMGDRRQYDWVIALRAVETVDFMTTKWARLPYDFLDAVANRIINEVEGISRVVYDISGKPPATIEWE